jgi:predicted nuclease of restriction endonuclease-like (RecB) superfamily
MNQINPADDGNWLQRLKDQIRTARLKASVAVNRELIQLYWRIGAEIVLQRATRSWGSKVLDQLAKDLRAEFPDMRGLSLTNLKYMALFGQAWPEEAIGQQAVDQLPWGQNIAVFTMISDRPTREWYIRKTIENGWSRAVLEMQIESQAHKRFGSAQNNFDRTLPATQSDLARDLIKDPYAFDFLGITDAVNERQIEQSLLNHCAIF